MSRFTSRVRKPVEREGAEHYVRLTLLSFAATVALTRLFLQLTGYPQLGSRTLHIAHLLWGGLLLFAATLLMAVLANRWVYTVGALLAGVGVGLFIDEVGKFITRTNDYFYPPAAPIIYAFFLLTVLLYLEIRRPPSRDARPELYRAFDTLQEVLDRDLDGHERAALEARLHHVIRQADHSDLARLAQELLNFLNSDAVYIAPQNPGLWDRILKWARAFEARWITRRRLKAILVGGLGVLGLVAVASLIQLFLATRSPARLEKTMTELVAVAQLTGARGLRWFSARIALDSAVGLLLLIAAGLLAANQDKHGIRLGYFGLLLSLTIVDLMVFYFNQFAAVTPAAIEFGLLLVVLHYQRRYLVPR